MFHKRFFFGFSRSRWARNGSNNPCSGSVSVGKEWVNVHEATVSPFGIGGRLPMMDGQSPVQVRCRRARKWVNVHEASLFGFGGRLLIIQCSLFCTFASAATFGLWLLLLLFADFEGGCCSRSADKGAVIFFFVFFIGGLSRGVWF